MKGYTTLGSTSLVCDDALPFLTLTADSGFGGCLLDAFCEDEGFAFAKLEEIEWRLIQRGVAALNAAFCSPPDADASIAPAG
ncbi:MAG: hypothetical protein EOO77_16700 [Oxalobacteraceae bacterium]|nr:MAG: hypothetical protein EOO77_16700 [Oxalobacteraceae bacterium]